MNKLDIIIPYYKEDKKLILRLLKSIQSQRNINFKEIGILLINDHSNNKITKKDLLDFPQLQITLLQTEKNVGPGLTRQKGIDFSTAEYITFIDADDTYYDSNCLSKIIDIINLKKPNLILSDWMEESFINHEKELLLHHSDLIFIHGKFIKRSYLKEKNISFSPELRLHEDSYFSTILLLSTPDAENTNIITNYWRYHNQSIVRAKNQYHYLVRTLSQLITNNRCVYKYLKNTENPFVNEYAIKACAYLYYTLSSYLFADKNDSKLQELKHSYESEFFDFLVECVDAFNETPVPLAQKYMNEQRTNFLSNMPDLGFTESWSDFFTRLSETFAE